MKRRLFIFFAIITLGFSSLAQVPVRGDLRPGGRGSTTGMPSGFNPGSINSPNSNGIPSDTTGESNAALGIDYDHVEEADSVLCNAIYLFDPIHIQTKVPRVNHPKLDPSGIAYPNPLDALDGEYYLGLGSLGQAHINLYPTLDRGIGFRFQQDVNEGLRKAFGMPQMRLVQRPFTILGFSSSLHQDYQVKVTHTQNIKPRWNIGFDVDLISREGVYTQSGVKSSFFDITTNYYSKDSRYQIEASLVRNCLSEEENGGVADDETCWNTSNRAGVPVNMYSAANEWKDLSLNVHQTYNTVKQFEYYRPITIPVWDTIADTTWAKNNKSDSILTMGSIIHKRDSITGYDTIQPHAPHIFNSGVFGIDFRAGNNRRNFYDNEPNPLSYPNFFYDNTSTFDSTRIGRIRADLYWTNDAYMDHKWKNPLVLLGGISPQMTRIRYTDSLSTDRLFSTALFAQCTISVKENISLSAKVEEMTGGYQNGDFRMHVAAELGKNLRLEGLSEAYAPDYFYAHYLSNNYAWDNASFNKIKVQQATARYCYEGSDSSILSQLNVKAQGSLITDNVWLNSNLLPTQGNETGSLLQGIVSGKMVFKWLHVDFQEMLQYSTNNNVMRVPLFASKNSIYADLKVFQGALWLQTGFDVRYHTRYYADGWSPALGAFYRQDEVQVGGYVWADFFATIQVKQASIYARVVHFNAPLEKSPSYFLLPHHPGEDLGVYFGVIWKFFN